MRKIALALFLCLLVPSLLFAQGYDRYRGRPQAQKSDAAVQFQVERISIGAGVFVGTFDWSKLYAAIQFHGLQLPFIKQGTSTGISVEGHVARLFTQQEGNVRVQQFESIDWRLWSTTRIPISAIPIGALQEGTVSRLWSGTDILLHESGKDWTGNFEARMVLGGDAGILGPGNVTFEVYMFQPQVPVSFAVFYSF